MIDTRSTRRAITLWIIVASFLFASCARATDTTSNVLTTVALSQTVAFKGMSISVPKTFRVYSIDQCLTIKPGVVLVGQPTPPQYPPLRCPYDASPEQELTSPGTSVEFTIPQVVLQVNRFPIHALIHGYLVEESGNVPWNGARDDLPQRDVRRHARCTRLCQRQISDYRSCP